MVTVIIPNYNGEAHLRTLLPSLLNQTYKEFRLILADNGSSDDSGEYLKSQVPDSIIIRMGKNLGFAKAINEGIRYSLKNLDSKFILLLNNDIELEPDFISSGIRAFENHPDISFVAAKMLNYYNRDIIDGCGDTIKLNGGSPIARGFGEKDKGQYDTGEYVFGVCAGAGFYKTELFKTAGLMDEKFISYYEDFDLSFRAELMGFKAYYEPKAVCYHKRGATSEKFTRGYQTEMCERNLVLLRFKNYPISLYLLYQPLFLFSRIRRIVFFYRDYSFKVFFSAIKGYLKGILLIPRYIPERRRIQKTKKVSVKDLRSLFVYE
jgi:GT2 family glycosyltransferase